MRSVLNSLIVLPVLYSSYLWKQQCKQWGPAWKHNEWNRHGNGYYKTQLYHITHGILLKMVDYVPWQLLNVAECNVTKKPNLKYTKFTKCKKIIWRCNSLQQLLMILVDLYMYVKVISRSRMMGGLHNAIFYQGAEKLAITFTLLWLLVQRI